MTAKKIQAVKGNEDLTNKGAPVRLGEEKFEFLISEVEDYAIILLALNGRIISWNKGAQHIKGYLASEVIGKSYKIFYPKEDVINGIPEMLLQIATQNGKANHEGWRVKKDGSRFWASVTITSIHGHNGDVTGFIKVTKDLTERKIAEDKLGNTIEELRIKNEELRKGEERYHKMVSEVQDYAIILLNPEGKILDWNKGAEKLKGYKAEEIIGKSFRLFYPLEDKQRDLPQQLLDKATKNGSVSHEGYRIRKDGTRFWGSVVVTSLHDDKGQLIGYSKVTKDLTERKIAEDKLAIFTHELQLKNEALRQSEERYHRMIAEVQDYAIILLSRDGIIQNWNTGAELIKGYSSQEIVGKSFKIFYTPEDIARGLPDKLLAEAELKGKASSEGWRKRKDGTRFWGSIIITALHNSEGDIIGFSKVTRDLTEKKRTEDSLKKNTIDLELKNHELERLNEELNSFAYVVSHDLKEPIRKIQIFAGRQLEPDKNIEQLKEYSRKIVSTASRMQRLMEALLSYSQISSNPTGTETVNLNQILSDVKNDLEIPMNDAMASVTATELPTVTGVAFQFHQLFLNLLSNSLKFAKPGEPPWINITSTVVSNTELPEQLMPNGKKYHLITFTDNGIGFEQEHASKIFDVFQRLKPRTSDSSGTGIGLAIVKKVVQNHEGLILAEGKPNEGAAFFLYLPVDERV